MRNLFAEGTYGAGVGISSPTIGGFRPLRMGQVTNQPASGMIPNTTVSPLAPGGFDKVKPDDRSIKPVIPVKVDQGKKRFDWAVGRLCTMMRRLQDSSANENAVSRVFWAFVRHARSSEESVLTAYKTLCPELTVPAKPSKPVPERKILPVPVTYSEAVQIAGELEKALDVVTPEKVAEQADSGVTTVITPEELPQAELLKEDLVVFVNAGDTGATLTVDQADVEAADKAIAQASTESGDKLKKGLLTAGALVGAGVLLYNIL